jgi:phenylacetate-CoA ligase
MQTTLTTNEINTLVDTLIPSHELSPRSIEAVTKLPSFYSKMQQAEHFVQSPYNEISHDIQDALVLRRLTQISNTVLLNPLWRDLLASGGVHNGIRSSEEWQQIPLSDKTVQRDFFMDTRPGMVVPLNHGGFEIVASGGTSSGQPLETVYSLSELQDTYKIAGKFMGNYQLREYLPGIEPKWVMTTLADYQMWSSGTMVGGVLQSIPGVNYIGAGPISKDVFQHIFSYPGPKVLMGITAGVAILTELGHGMDLKDRETFRVALYGSGVLPQRKQAELKAMYPNLVILSYFAATQAETIGLQLSENSPALAAVPGLHFIEIVDDKGRWVEEGQEGELVVTRLHAHEAPLLRFKVGDRMIRHPRLGNSNFGPGLKTQQFEFSGRSNDVLHLNDTQYAAPQAYASLCRELKAATLVDLEALAVEIQFINHRKNKTLTLMAAVDDVDALTSKIVHHLGPESIRQLFTQALINALSLFNQCEANPYSIEKTGYQFELKLVSIHAPEIHRTLIGKTPLLRDIF